MERARQGVSFWFVFVCLLYFILCIFFLKKYEVLRLHHLGVSPSHHFLGVTTFILGTIVAVLILLLVPPNLLGFLVSVASLPTAFSLPVSDKLLYS